MYEKSFKIYFISSSNIMNLSMCVIYLCSYGLKYSTIIIVALKRAQISHTDFWAKVSSLEFNDIKSQKDVFETFYWLNAGKLIQKA